MKARAALAALLFMMGRWTADVSGKVIDRTGKPLANAQVVYTNEENGRTYKFKTNKKGEFSGIGVIFGVYAIEITGPDGESLYRTRRRIADPNVPDFKKDTNVLNADLSVISLTDMPGGIKANVRPDKLDEKQKDAIRTHNANVEKMNEEIRRLHAALEAQQWAEATEILNQLIADDPGRWEFYQNLGTIQSNQSHYEDAARSYERGIELAQSGVTTGTQPDKREIGLMMIYAGDAYLQLGNTDKAVAWYSKAAELSPDPAMAYFNVCRARRASGDLDAAAEACTKAIASSPNRWEFHQLLGTIRQAEGQDQLAIEAFNQGIQVAEILAATNSNALQAKTGMGQMLSAEGNIYAHMKKFDEAIATFNRAAQFDSYPARDYFNICAALYNTDKMEAAASACDQAIASDPKMAEAYFLKASALLARSKSDHGKLAVPAGTQEALNKYLQLDPQGEHARDARQMLASIGAK